MRVQCVPYFVMQYFVSFKFCNHYDGEGRADCFIKLTYFFGSFASHRVTGRVQSVSQLWDDHFPNGMTQYVTKVLSL